MRVVREQMLCVISPGWTGGLDAFSAVDLQALRDFFKDLGIVHFASLALLPNRPGSSPVDMPSLMLELAVDEGIRPEDLLTRLARHPSGALWMIYSPFFAGSPNMSPGERNECMLRHMLSCVSIADGAFVGPRDRSVAQIHQERFLFMKTREEAQLLLGIVKKDRTSLALTLARWAYQQPDFEQIATRAPISFWRSNSAGKKLAYLGLILAGGLVATWLVMKLLGFLGSCLSYWASFVHPWILGIVIGLLGGGVSALWFFLHASLRLLLVVAFGAMAYGFVFALLPNLYKPLGRWLDQIQRELDRPSQTWSSRLTCIFGWFAFAGLLAAVTSAGLYVIFGADGLWRSLNWLTHHNSNWVYRGFIAYVLAFLVLFLILAVGLGSSFDSSRKTTQSWLASRFVVFRRWFHHPFEVEVPRAQQVHASVEQCEAELAPGTAHMISLTDLRRPYWWSAFWTRLALRFVTFFGYVHFTEGTLNGAPGIQYSHWHIIDNGRRLLFCANFDGTFGGYLDDFINGPSLGTTLFWRWTHLLPRNEAATGHPAVARNLDFPPTRLLVFRGVKCELKFKTYARESMLPHLFRFDACELSAKQKIQATDFRDALFGERTDAKDDFIVRTLES